MLTFQNAAQVTPSDTVQNRFSALYVADAGDVAIVPQSGPTAGVVFTVAAGTYIWVATSLVLDTGTTAADIIGLG